MGLISRYRTWRIVHLLNRIPNFLSKEEFEEADSLLEKASKLYDCLPEHVQRRNIRLNDLFIEMKKLLGSEFRRKLDLQLNSESISRYSMIVPSKKKYYSLHNLARPQQIETRNKVKNDLNAESLNKMEKVMKRIFKSNKNISALKKQTRREPLVKKPVFSKKIVHIPHNHITRPKVHLHKNKKIVKKPAPKIVHHAAKPKIVSKPAVVAPVVKAAAKTSNRIASKINDLQNKITDWKKQGYDTTILEKELASFKR